MVYLRQRIRDPKPLQSTNAGRTEKAEMIERNQRCPFSSEKFAAYNCFKPIVRCIHVLIFAAAKNYR